jgi:Zn-dependent M28 family amino/carboxypeptidase
MVALVAGLGFGTSQAAGGRASIAAADLRTWLTYLASDELAGRAVFSEGLGLAAGYIQSHLAEWRLKPAGDNSTFLQTVRVRGVKVVSRSSLSVKVGGQTRVFKDGEGVTFSRNVGGKRTLAVDRVEFAGYGLDAPGAKHLDFAGRSLEGAAVVFLGAGPSSVDLSTYRRVLNGRSRYATDQLRALATIGPPPRTAAPEGEGENRAHSAPEEPTAAAVDFTTARDLEASVPPAVSGSDALFDFLFSKAPVPYSELKHKAGNRDALPAFTLDGVSLTFHIDAEYDVLRTQRTENIVAVVEGSDPQLKSTYVAFGAHYDHVGYSEAEPSSEERRRADPGRVTPGASKDRIWNGADDDGSGTVGLMALARAFAQGHRPKRSLLFVWHAGEERGLWGSRYFTDHPPVPLEKIVAHLNMDMIGRNRDNKRSEANTVYLVGSDRISSELHELNRAANQSLDQPLKLDYEMNDPADLEQMYYRSDHYSYAAKGIPVIFFTTGLHPDYHANTDEVDKIEFAKLARIAQLVYETGSRLASQDHAPARDYRGARAGRGTP